MFLMLIYNPLMQKSFTRSQVPAIGEFIRFTEDGRFYTVKNVEWQYFMDAEYDVIVYVE